MACVLNTMFCICWFQIRVKRQWTPQRLTSTLSFTCFCRWLLIQHHLYAVSCQKPWFDGRSLECPLKISVAFCSFGLVQQTHKSPIQIPEAVWCFTKGIMQHQDAEPELHHTILRNSSPCWTAVIVAKLREKQLGPRRTVLSRTLKGLDRELVLKPPKAKVGNTVQCTQIAPPFKLMKKTHKIKQAMLGQGAMLELDGWNVLLLAQYGIVVYTGTTEIYTVYIYIWLYKHIQPSHMQEQVYSTGFEWICCLILTYCNTTVLFSVPYRSHIAMRHRSSSAWHIVQKDAADDPVCVLPTLLKKILCGSRRIQVLLACPPLEVVS